MNSNRAERDAPDWRYRSGERPIVRPSFPTDPCAEDETGEPPFSVQEPEGLPTQPDLEPPPPPADFVEPFVSEMDTDLEDLRDTIPAPVPPPHED